MICRKIDADTAAVLEGLGAGDAACAAITEITWLTFDTGVIATGTAMLTVCAAIDFTAVLIILIEVGKGRDTVRSRLSSLSNDRR